MTTKPTETQPFFTHWEYEKAQEQINTMQRKSMISGLSDNEKSELEEYLNRTAITPAYFFNKTAN
jgi:5-formaminoimidazole-4-carboxamide-1-beta-D-ribofuranosyl 5'-monophosphate synthetase